MNINEKVKQGFNELELQSRSVRMSPIDGRNFVDDHTWQKWSSSVMNLLHTAFGESSIHFKNFKKIHDDWGRMPHDLDSAKGVFLSAKDDFEGGYIFSLENAISGEIFGDFINLAKQSLSEDYKDVAAVLACAALEDALKRYAASQDLNIQDESMQQVVNALKSKGLVSGAQKSLLDTMPKIRDYAMHANWDKIKPEDVNSVIGFVEQFVISKF